jgi:hypothetical protein
MFKDFTPEGKVVKCSKGGYDFGMDTFAYRICDDGEKYNIMVQSDVNPRMYSVPYGDEVTIESLETAILYNEWRARVWEGMEKERAKENNTEEDI